jgi:hypothetical protein
MVAAVFVAVDAKLFRGVPGECEESHRGISIMQKHDEGQGLRVQI